MRTSRISPAALYDRGLDASDGKHTRMGWVDDTYEKMGQGRGRPLPTLDDVAPGGGLPPRAPPAGAINQPPAVFKPQYKYQEGTGATDTQVPVRGSPLRPPPPPNRNTLTRQLRHDQVRLASAALVLS